jgi:hypothetical protein
MGNAVGTKRSRRMLAALGCAVVMSIAAPMAAHAAEVAEVAEVAAPVFEYDALPAGKVNLNYRHQFTFTGNARSIVAEHLPAGLRMEPSGLLTGVPTEANRSGRFTIAAFDWNTMQLVEQRVDYPAVAEPERPVITGELPDARIDTELFYRVHATTTPANLPLTFSASGLPHGYAITPAGVITGERGTKAGSYPITITASAHPPGGVPVSGSVEWTLNVYDREVPVIIGELPSARQNVEFSYQVQATAPMDTSLTFSAAGLPDGFSIAPDGLMTGKPYTKPGSYPVTFTATATRPGGVPVSGSVTWILTVMEPEKPVITGSGLARASSAEQYAHTVHGTGPAGTSLTFTARGLPEGYGMAPVGRITGRSGGKPGIYNVTITVTAQRPGTLPVSSSVTWKLEVVGPKAPALADPPTRYGTADPRELRRALE